jgi:ATP phosphoribosyltransferase
MSQRDRLRIAVQKSGRLSESSLELLGKCGLSFRFSRDKLFCFGESLPIDLLLVRDDDIPGMIAQGVCELGLVGQNVSREQAVDARLAGKPPGFVELRELDFGRCRLSIAVPQEFQWTGISDLAGKRIATSYPALLQEYLSEQNVQATPVMLSGSVEIAPRLGTADLICDLVSSGATLTANALKEVTVILQSQAVLLGSAQTFVDERASLIDLLLRRLDGVIRLRESKLLLLAVERANLAAVLEALPDADVPQISAIQSASSTQLLSVQVVCHKTLTWPHLEALRALGASNIMVLPVEKMLS